jgi:FimV-like protein
VAKRPGKVRRRADGDAGPAAEERDGGEERPASREQGSRAPARSPALSRAQAAIRRGDFRSARAFAKEVAAHGDESEREQARRLLANLSPDPAALLAAVCVLLAIVIAAALALFRAR